MEFHGEGAVPELVGITSFQNFYITPFTAGFCRWLYFTSGMSSPPKRGGYIFTKYDKHILEILVGNRFGYQQVDIISNLKIFKHEWLKMNYQLQ